MSTSPPSAEEFLAIVKSNRIVFVKWGAAWCGPCRNIQPIYDGLARQYKDLAPFLCIEVDDEEFENLAVTYQIKSFPTFHVFVDQKPVKSITGANARALIKLVQEFILPVKHV